MKNIYTILLLIIFSAASASGQNFNWQQINADPPMQQGMQAFHATESGKLFAGSFQGVIKSTDGGLTWESTSLSGYAYNFFSDAHDNTIAVLNDGVYITITFNA